MLNKNLFWIVGIIFVVGIAGRFLPHAPNTTPITALALFVSAYVGFRYSALAVLLVMFVSDSLIGFYHWPIMISVYGSFILAGLLGTYLQKNKTIGSVFGVALCSSFLFFLITNWAVWQFSTMYPHNFGGLMQSYIMAIPFFKNSLIGDIFYTGSFFGLFEGVKYFVLRNKIFVS